MRAQSAARLKVRFQRKGIWVEGTLHEESLLREVLDHERLGPDAEVLLGGRWTALRDHPSPPWSEPMAERAVRAVEAFAPREAAHAADMILRFHTRSDNEAIPLAHFVLGHLRLCEGQPREAVGHLQIASATRSGFQAAAA